MMRTRDLFFLPLALASVFLGPSALQDPGAGLVAEARAQDALSTCTLKGAPLLSRGLQLFDSVKDGKVIAEFIGGAVPLALTVPEDPENSRAKISSSAGKPSFRLEGWLSMESIPVYTIKDVDVVADHVKIAAGHRVKMTKGAKTRLTAELTIAGSQSQTLKGTGGCNAFSLDWSLPSIPEPPEKARHYLMKTTSLDLFDKANGESIYTLNMTDGASPLFYSIESRGMFMHVMSRTDTVIDAWVKMGTLTPIKKGDRIESPPSKPATGPGARMILDSPPPLKTAPKDLLVRPSREDTSKAVGVMEKGAEFYVTQVVSGWANVLPKDLNFSPPSGGGFWIKNDDIP